MCRDRAPAIALPAITHCVEGLEPPVAPVLGARRAADHHSSARGKGALERGAGRLGIEPMDCAADGDDVEGAEFRGDILEPALDEPDRDAGALGPYARGSTMPGSGSTPMTSRQ
jgi:hypothetical protein